MKTKLSDVEMLKQVVKEITKELPMDKDYCEEIAVEYFIGRLYKPNCIDDLVSDGFMEEEIKRFFEILESYSDYVQADW